MNEERVKAWAEITCVATGETRRHETTWGESVDEYLWSDGNYACDCNRSLFFQRAGGVANPGPRECGMSAFTVRIVDAAGRVLYDEDEE